MEALALWGAIPLGCRSLLLTSLYFALYLPRLRTGGGHRHRPGVIVCGQDSLLGKSAIPELCLGMGLATEAALLSALV